MFCSDPDFTAVWNCLVRRRNLPQMDCASDVFRDVATPSSTSLSKRERLVGSCRRLRALRTISKHRQSIAPGNSIGETRQTCVGFAYNFPQPALLTSCMRSEFCLQAALLTSLHRV